MMLECELELHVFNKWLTAECTSLNREMRLTYVTMKLKVSLDNISKCFAMLHVFCIVVNCIFSCLLFFRILCIEMLHVYQRVESSHETRTGFFLFVSRIVVFLFFFFVRLLYWNEDSTIKKKSKRTSKHTYKMYTVKKYFPPRRF